MRYVILFVMAGILTFLAGQTHRTHAEEPKPTTDEAVTEPEAPATIPQPDNAGSQAPPKRVLAKDPPGMKRLDPNYNAWLDPKFKRVVVDGEICLREGQLEMFACLKGTKEHESIVAIDCKAFILHAALLAVGAKAGAPVQFRPEYKPATGTAIEIGVVWTDADGVHRARAQDWIKNVKTGKPLEYDWVFGGSGFYEDEETKQRNYMAEGGDLICVSNFGSAMLDLPIESSQTNNELIFSCNTEAIPPKGTKVRLVLTPKLDETK